MQLKSMEIRAECSTGMIIIRETKVKTRPRLFHFTHSHIGLLNVARSGAELKAKLLLLPLLMFISAFMLLLPLLRLSNNFMFIFFDFVFIQFISVCALFVRFFPYLLFTVTSWIGVPNGFWREHICAHCACAYFQFRFCF